MRRHAAPVGHALRADAAHQRTLATRAPAPTFDKETELTVAAFYVEGATDMTPPPELARRIARLRTACAAFPPDHEVGPGVAVKALLIEARWAVINPAAGFERLRAANADYRALLLGGAGSRPVDGWPWEQRKDLT